MGMWRNWYTRTLEERMEQSLEVQILSCPPGRSIPVVHTIRVRVDWVRFPAARHFDSLCSLSASKNVILNEKLFLSVAGGRTHIGTYVGVSPSLASNENNKKCSAKIFAEHFSLLTSLGVIHSFACKSIVISLEMRDNCM